MSIRTEDSVKIITEIDARTESVSTRDSMIYDSDGDTLILAQTEPPIESSMLDQEVLVTYVVTDERNYVRYGIRAVIMEFLNDFQPEPGRYAQAIAVRRCSRPEPYNMRSRYRVQPSGKSGLDVFIHRKKVTVVDISLGGMRFSYDERLRLEVNKVVEVGLAIGRETHTVEARIIRIWEREAEFFKTEVRFAAAEFRNMSRRFEEELSRKIREIERERPSVVCEI
jgi:hypothetical protein